jgi:glycosyltransferase involved in cell wall biosynthesis
MISTVIKLVEVSVVMASYNYRDYLPEAIESVLNQSFKDLELIIIDDFSTDYSQETIQAYQTNDPRIRSVFHKVNLGISKTLNEGLDLATGKFVALLDSDDVWLKTKLEKQLKILEKNEDLVVWSEGVVINQIGRPVGTTFTQMHNALRKKKTGNIFETLLCGNFVLGSSIIFKKDHISKIRFNKDLKYLNDHRFFVDLARYHSYSFIEEPLTKYRIHGKNTLFRDQQNWDHDRIRLCNYFIKEYGDVISKKVKSYLLYRIGRSYFGIGEKGKGRLTIFGAIRTNPFSLDNLIYLGSTFRAHPIIH